MFQDLSWTCIFSWLHPRTDNYGSLVVKCTDEQTAASEDEAVERQSWQCWQSWHLRIVPLCVPLGLSPMCSNSIKVRGPKTSLRARLCWDGWALPAQQGNGYFVCISWAFLHAQEKRTGPVILLNSKCRYHLHRDRDVSIRTKEWPAENKSHTRHRSRRLYRLQWLSPVWTQCNVSMNNINKV